MRISARKRSVDPRRSPLGLLGRATALTILIAAAGSGPPAEALAVPSTGVQLTPTTQERLARIQEQWLQWVSAFYQDNPERADAVLEDIEDAVHSLGFARLPDLSLAVLNRAVEAAEAGELERAAWGLEVAVSLDPGRPEIWFAYARIARLEGRPLAAARFLLYGYSTLLDDAADRGLWLQNATLWVLLGGLLAGVAFLALQVVAKGPRIYGSMIQRFSQRLPRLVAHGVVLAGLLWPLALPGGPIWLLLYWSVLLWAYCSVSERWVFAGLWLALLIAPALVLDQSRRVTVNQSPPMRAVAYLQQDRLYGGFFTDLGVLPAVLPESPAVRQLLADLHVRMDQWEPARAHYRSLLDLEPSNEAALINLGVYSYRQGDFATAIDYFRQATAVDQPNAESFYNLSLALSASYLFEESRDALWLARGVDTAKVTRWIREGPEERTVTLLGGLDRLPEIRRQLGETWKEPHRGGRLGRWEVVAHTGASVAGLLLLAVAFRWWQGGTAPFPNAAGRGSSRLAAALLPGWRSVLETRGVRAFGALLPLAALAVLPLFESFGYRIAWGLTPGEAVLWVCAGAGVGLLLLGRLILVRG